jgi:hypothetical protein
MDEQARDSLLPPRAQRDTLSPAAKPEEKPVSAVTALLLIGAGAIAILMVAALLFSMSPGSRPFSTAPAPTQDTGDGFAAVRRKAEDSFQKGQALYAQGSLDQALVELDRASVNDPDHRQDIQDLLQKVVASLRERDAKLAGPVATQATPVAGGPLPTLAPKLGFDAYANLSTGITLLEPAGWKRSDGPKADAGEGVVEFADASGAARFTVSRDTPAQPVSPELYAATLETHMQSLPGYQSEQVQLINIGLLPGVKRVFRLDGTSPSGKEPAVRVVQTVLGSGGQTYILTGAADPSKFDDFRPTFETMTNSFRVR